MSPFPVLSALPMITTGSPPIHDEAETRILDAVVRLIGESGEANLTVDDVAATSGVARATIFRRFGSRNAMITATYAREAHSVVAAAQAAGQGIERADEALAVAFATFVEVTVAHPVIRRLATAEPDIMVRHWREGNPTGLVVVRALIQSTVTPASMGLTPAALDGVCDTLARMLFTCILLPGDQSSPWRDHARRTAEARALVTVLVADATRRAPKRRAPKRPARAG